MTGANRAQTARAKMIRRVTATLERMNKECAAISRYVDALGNSYKKRKSTKARTKAPCQK